MTSDNIAERLNKARKIIASQSFKKSGTVQGGQKYNFIPISDILDAVRKAHADAGVNVLFGAPQYDAEQFEKRYSYTKKGQYGDTLWQAANGHIHVIIFGASVDDCIETDIPFEAQDNSDKLTNKIITNAERCLYRVLYAIDEGDATDPEAFHEEIPAQVQTEEKPRKRKIPTDDPFSRPPIHSWSRRTSAMPRIAVRNCSHTSMTYPCRTSPRSYPITSQSMDASRRWLPESPAVCIPS